jgi:hypothetical protein
MVDPKHIAKAKAKSLFKVSGVLANYRMVNDKLMEFIIRKGSGKTTRNFVFKTFDEGIRHKIGLASSKARFLVKFKIDCKEWNGRWFTDLWVVEVEDWAVNADKVAREDKNKRYVEAQIAAKTENEGLFGNAEGW